MAQTTSNFSGQASPPTHRVLPLKLSQDPKTGLSAAFFQPQLTWDDMSPEEIYLAIKDSKLRATAAPFRPGAPGHHCKFRPNPKASPSVPATQKARELLVVNGSSSWVEYNPQEEDSSSARSSSPPTSESD
jgi:hypothetical protein